MRLSFSAGGAAARSERRRKERCDPRENAQDPNRLNERGYTRPDRRYREKARVSVILPVLSSSSPARR